MKSPNNATVSCSVFCVTIDLLYAPNCAISDKLPQQW
jgi:hypothetical protein